jgi:hypothetical protein
VSVRPLQSPGGRVLPAPSHRWLLVTVATCALVLLSAGFAQAATAASISGTVTDSDGAAITSADICVSATGTSYGFAQSTASGTYTLASLSPGTYTLTFSDCYASTRNDLSATYKSSITVADGEVKTGVDQQLKAATSVSGHVYGGAGSSTPLSGVCVTAYDPASSFASSLGYASTDAQGAYVVKHLDPGNAGVKVGFSPCSSSSAYAPEFYDGVGDLASAATLTPTLANPSVDIDAHLHTGASISGTVTDAAGDAITSGDVCVSSSRSDGGSGSGSATTDSEGKYTITGLAAGSYYVQFSDCYDSQRNDVSVYYGGSLSSSASTLVVLSASGAKTGVDAQLPAGSSISGTVYAGDGTSSPLSQVCVSVNPAVYTPDSNYYGYASTASDGTYTVRHVPVNASGYRVQFRHCQTPAVYVSQYYGGDYESGSGTAVTPGAQSPSTGIDGHLATGGVITGAVRDDAGHPITSRDICVSAYRTSSDAKYYSMSVTSTAEGTYSISGLPAGPYSVSFNDCSYVSPGATVRNDQPLTLTAVDVTAPGTTGGHDAALKPGTSISGHVYGGPGTAVKLSNVCAMASESTSEWSSSQQATTTTTGEYTIRHLDPTKSYKVRFQPCYYGTVQQYSPQYYDGVSDFASASTLSPTLEAPSTGVDAHLVDDAPLTTITGGPAASAATSDPSATFTFTSNAAGATFACALDGAALTTCSSPFKTGTLGAGQHTFQVRAAANGKTQAVPKSVTWTVNPSAETQTSQGAVAQGGTFSSDPDEAVSATNPVAASVTLPAAGQVTLTKQPATTTSGNGYSVLGRQLDIAATATGGGAIVGTAANPIKLSFVIDASEIPAGTALSKLTVLRNGAPAADCTGAGATPDPCVKARSALSGGRVQLDVLTTHCSTWNVAVRDNSFNKPTNTSSPGISGTPDVGQTLTIDVGTWSGDAPVTYTYRWTRDGAPIAGATGLEHRVTPADRGHTLAAEVTATNPGGSTVAISPGVAIRSETPATSDPPAAKAPAGVSGASLRPPSGPPLVLRALKAPKLGKALGAGLAFSLSCDGGCDVGIAAKVDGKTAKRVKLVRKAAKPVTVGTAKVALTGKTRTVVVRFTKAARRALRQQRSVKIAVTFTAKRGGDGPATTVVKSVMLRR